MASFGATGGCRYSAGAGRRTIPAVSEWRSVVTQGLFLAVIMELVEIGKWVFTDGWSGVFRFHLRLNRQLLAHGISLLYAGAFV